jgi:hypothetical protein
MLGFWEIYLAVFIGTGSAVLVLLGVWWVFCLAVGRPVRHGSRESRETFDAAGLEEVSQLRVEYRLQERSTPGAEMSGSDDELGSGR